MKITDVRIYKVSPPGGVWLWVAVETDEGITGWGEISDGICGDTVAGYIHTCSRKLIGTDPLNMIRCTGEFHQWRFPSIQQNQFAAIAASGMDQALWDLTARFYHIPLYKMLGGHGNNKIRLYANLNRGLHRNRTPEVLKQKGKAAYEAGFRVVKCTPFDGIIPKCEFPDIEAGMEMIMALSEEVPLSRIAIDCHERFSRMSLSRLVNRLYELPELPYWLEDTISVAKDREGFMQVRAKYPEVRWTGGEEALHISELYDLMKAGLFDVLMPDVKFIGGISALRTILPLMESLNILPSLHCPSGPISMAHSTHAAAIAPSMLPIEYPWDVVADREEATCPSEPVRNGIYHLSNEPGIGLVPEKNYLQKYAEIWSPGQWGKI